MNQTDAYQSIQSDTFHPYHACNDCKLNNGQVVGSVEGMGLMGCSLEGEEAQAITPYLNGKKVFTCTGYRGITGYFSVTPSRHDLTKKKKKGRC